MSENLERVQCLILGSGPAGYTTAIYTCRADLKTVIYEGPITGGQLMQTTEIENFPGYPQGVHGGQMMQDIRQQAERFGVEFRMGSIVEVDTTARPFRVKSDSGDELLADTIVVATGASARWLGVKGEEQFKGGGVSACATCDGYFFRGKDVAVVGGGDTACEDATYLSHLCNKVYLIVRRDVLRASKAMQHRVLNTPNIEVLWNTQTKELFGEVDGFMATLQGAVLYDSKTGEERTINIDGFFEAISIFMSLMFPTIYGIALENVSTEDSTLGAAFLVMAIVGGALMPPLQGMIIDLGTVASLPAVNFSFILPFICFLVIFVYGYRTSKETK